MTAASPPAASLHWPTLGIALLIMVSGTLYPRLMADATGKADHGLAIALLWTMSAGFVRGVGFVPRLAAWRWLFSGWSVLLAAGTALMLKLQH